MLPDNLSIYEAHEYDRESELEHLPKCDWCNEHIQDDHYFDVNGDRVCEDCFDNWKQEIRRPIYDV